MVIFNNEAINRSGRPPVLLLCFGVIPLWFTGYWIHFLGYYNKSESVKYQTDAVTQLPTCKASTFRSIVRCSNACWVTQAHFPTTEWPEEWHMALQRIMWTWKQWNLSCDHTSGFHILRVQYLCTFMNSVWSYTSINFNIQGRKLCPQPKHLKQT